MTRPEQHRVLDLSFHDRWLICTCGETMEPEPDVFYQHRKAAGARWASISSTIGARIPGDPELVYGERPMFPVVKRGVAA